MREIKFRAWDEIANPMVGVTVLEWNKGRTKDGSDKRLIYLRGYVPGGVEVQSTAPDYLERFKLMQYTGLKDKNGKEIYEGDIVTKHEKYTEKLGEKNYEVCFHKCSFGIKYEQYGNQYFSQTDLENFEVIGNIYENSELLK